VEGPLNRTRHDDDPAPRGVSSSATVLRYPGPEETVIQAIETHYAGRRFRSRTEARWAVYFDAMGIPWEYEPQGYEWDGRRYLPDFLLPECGTWVEVKGAAEALDTSLMEEAVWRLPEVRARPGADQGPKLMLLGSIPGLPPIGSDWAWTEAWRDCHYPLVSFGSARFGIYWKNLRPWGEDVSTPDWGLSPRPCEDTGPDLTRPAYERALSARFEHGETPLTDPLPRAKNLRRT